MMWVMCSPHSAAGWTSERNRYSPGKVMCNKQLERGSATGLRSKRFFQNEGLTGTMELGIQKCN